MRTLVHSLLLLSSLIGAATIAAPGAGASSATTKPKPPQLKDDWKGLKRLPDEEKRVWSAKDGSEFGLSDHRALAAKAAACSEQTSAALTQTRITPSWRDGVA